MDIKSRSFSHSLIAKALAFVLVIFCFTQVITLVLNVINRSHFGVALEKSYYLGEGFIDESNTIISDLRSLSRYKSEENILAGGTISEDRLRNRIDSLYWEFQVNSDRSSTVIEEHVEVGVFQRSASSTTSSVQSGIYNPNLSDRENYQIFLEAYKEEIEKEKERLIQEDLYYYQTTLQRLASYKGLNYFLKSGELELTNHAELSKEGYTSYPAYMLFEGFIQNVHPQEIKENPRFHWITPDVYSQDYPDVLYIGFEDEFLNPRIAEWQEDKEVANYALYRIVAYLAGLIASFIYLLAVWGRNSKDDQEIHLNTLDRLYNDFNVAICLALIISWFASCEELYRSQNAVLIYPTTLVIATLGLIFVLSLVKHIKNRTLFKHTLVYTIFHKFFSGIKAIYDSGSLGMKVAILAIGYPLCVALTFFMFPITIGLAVWLSFKKVKEFKAIKEGVRQVKEGDLATTINIKGRGEFAQLAGDINSITDGLNKAVENEIKSERLKTELITNVSHDIRTPLTSIITYVDLLKTEEDPEKIKEYVEVLDQKSQRLKVLTDDLFEAAKASSGDIPVTFERIDIVSLLTQGLGEVDEKIQERKLDFKFNYPRERIWVKADGRLLWRSIENLLSNIFKYALEGSRVYIDLEDMGPGVRLTIKNISAYELNISSSELMERFKRGDESRSSQGSGLGLSIVTSLIEIQKGSFTIEVDGDLFKVIIFLYKDDSKETPLYSE
ncbi:sensor histidine kinase KdpD [Desulfitobacterium sp. PCE1]|uniref:sensor histidine kinase n=1 Tax=Desulfitobacterium sp. PCE1 TaxID=146907 RepID=UPI00037DB549|nr:HAMP domain-containing sensor histidine kinase [Desulfitobacterium sp. PCE1]